MVGCSKYDNEPSDSIIFWEFRDWMGNCWLVNKNFEPWS